MSRISPFSLLSTLLLLVQAVAAVSSASDAAAAASVDAADYRPEHIIDRDVAIIGGGSAGIYSAVQLADKHKSVVVVEKKDHIGGHAETYTDPATGTNINLGVVVFANTSTVNNYFSRLKVPLIPLTGGGAPSTQYVDFSTGKTVKFQPPSDAAFGAALVKYSAQLAKYPELQQGFNLTYPIHPDLLIPFGAFIKKYGLQDLVATVFRYNQGYAQLLDITTLYMLKYLNTDQVTSFERAYLTTASYNTHDLYAAATTALHPSNILLSSSVLRTSHSPHAPAHLAISTPSGPRLIRARRILLAAPPTPATLRPLSPPSAALALASRFTANGYGSAVLTDAGLLANDSLSAADPSKPYGIPLLPGPYTASLVPGTQLAQVFYGSPRPLDTATAQRAIVDALVRRAKALGRPVPRPRIVAYTDHSPFNLMVSPRDIKAGFYQRLEQLQGQSGIWYAGAAWQAQDSSVIWAQIDRAVLPGLLAGL